MDQFRRSQSVSKLSKIFAQHKRVGLQFSGGKDSLACLHLLKPYWDRLIVLWGNPGDEFPETHAQMQEVAQHVHEFHEVRGNSDKERAFPVDLMPARSTALGIIIEAGDRIPIQSRFECCFRNFWIPMAAKVKELGITALIRGQRQQEELKAPLQEGSKDCSGAEIFLPIEDWTTDEVFEFLAEQEVTLPPFYRYMKAGPKCMRCTAWQKDQRGKSQYLREHHPEIAKEYEWRMGLVAQAILPDVKELQKTLEEINGL